MALSPLLPVEKKSLGMLGVDLTNLYVSLYNRSLLCHGRQLEGYVTVSLVPMASPSFYQSSVKGSVALRSVYLRIAAFG